MGRKDEERRDEVAMDMVTGLSNRTGFKWCELYLLHKTRLVGPLDWKIMWMLSNHMSANDNSQPSRIIAVPLNPFRNS